MLAVAHAGSLEGVDALPVRVEVQLGKGLPGRFEVVGLPERAVRESRVRVMAALDACGFERPPHPLILNLAPGDVRKHGAGFDLAIAMAVLAACGHVPKERVAATAWLGELSLDASVRTVRGVLPLLHAAARSGLSTAVIPGANAGEGALSSGMDVWCAESLPQLVDWLKGGTDLPRAERNGNGDPCPSLDMSDVKGQEGAKRALEVAAAGEHHVLLIGPPGSGKTMLASRFGSLLPKPTAEEALTIATVASAAGLAVPGSLDEVARPFRAPHHTASAAALVGGGQPIRPGELTLAHGGVLFLDELPEFRRDVLEGLRTTMESGQAVIARASSRVSMPAAPVLVAAMNPCPCGYAGDSRRACMCGQLQVARYRSRVSGPVVDRFDLHIAVPRVSARALRRAAQGESSAAIRTRVLAARQARRERGRDTLELLLRDTDTRAVATLERAVEKLGLSARAFLKALRVARTIADLEGATAARVEHVSEAVQYRFLDRSQGVAGASIDQDSMRQP